MKTAKLKDFFNKLVKLFSHKISYKYNALQKLVWYDRMPDSMEKCLKASGFSPLLIVSQLCFTR